MTCKILSCLLLVHCTALSQSIISGVVTDMESGQQIPSAHVFINNTTIGTVTDQQGRFALRNVPTDPCQFIVSILGYDNYVLSLPSNRTNLQLSVRLNTKHETLETLTISAKQDKEWERNLKLFKREFLGRSPHASTCEIVNPWVLEFNKKGPVFRAEASQPLQILNHALGYEVTFHLDRFEYTGLGYSIAGPVRFRELDDPEKFKAPRNSSFEGSSKHFFKLLLKNQHNEQGFKIYRSINLIEEQQRTRRFRESLPGLADLKHDDLVKTDEKGGLTVVSSRPIEIHYEAARDLEPVYQDVLHQVSWIQSRTGTIELDSTGNILNQQDVIVSGYWNQLRVADLLPLDFEPGTEVVVDTHEELLVITDKSIFDKGANAWYTVLSTARSETTFVQLLDSLGNVLASRIDPITNGLAAGQFQLPETVGTYYIRAMTAQSFGSSQYFAKPILVTSTASRLLECTDREQNASLVSQVNSTDSNALLNLSLLSESLDTLREEYSFSITPAGMDCDCLDGRSLTFQKPENVVAPHSSITRGYVAGKDGKPVGGRVVIFTTDLSFSIERSISQDGSFLVDDIDFYDSTSWLAQVYDQKDRAIEGFAITTEQLVMPNAPSFDRWKLNCPWLAPEKELLAHVGPTENVRKVRDELKLSDSTRVLSGVTIPGKRIRQNQKPQTNFRAYGPPQYVVKGEDIVNNPAGINLLNTLAGRVPGLTINEGYNNWGGGKTKILIRGKNNPVVILDGMPITDLSMAYDILQSIPLTDVDRVEVRTALSPMMGLNGVSGVIAVYTKRSAIPEIAVQQSAPTVQKLAIGGYSTPPKFRQDTTARPTYYWNPRVSFDQAPATMNLSQLPSDFNVLLSGITPNGKVVHVRKKIATGK